MPVEQWSREYDARPVPALVDQWQQQYQHESAWQDAQASQFVVTSIPLTDLSLTQSKRRQQMVGRVSQRVRCDKRPANADRDESHRVDRRIHRF